MQNNVFLAVGFLITAAELYEEAEEEEQEEEELYV